MGFLDFFRSKSNRATDAYGQILNAIGREVAAEIRDGIYSRTSYASLEGYKALLTKSNEFKTGFLLFLYDVVKSANDNGKTIYTRDDKSWQHATRIIKSLLKDVSLTDAEILQVATIAGSLDKIPEYERPTTQLIAKVEEYVHEKGKTPAIDKALIALNPPRTTYEYASVTKAREQIEFLSGDTVKLAVDPNDDWGKVALKFLNGLDKDRRSKWVDLFTHSKAGAGKNSPSQKWVKEAKPYVDAIGNDQFKAQMIAWLAFLRDELQGIHKAKDFYKFLRDENHEIVKGLIWATGLVNDSSLHTAVDEYAVWAYKKFPGVGSLSARTGTAAMFAFSLLPVTEGVSRISKFRTKIKNRTILKSINKILNTVAARHEVGLEEMEEMSLPSFNIVDGKLLMPMAGCVAQYNVEEDELKWQVGNKLQKTIPAEVKDNFQKEVKLLKDQIKEIKSLVPVIAARLERSYLSKRSWDVRTWRERYFDHPLAHITARKLIWHFSMGDRKSQGIFLNGVIVDVSGESIPWIDDKQTRVELWHPIGFASETVLSWRNLLRQHSIVQPFKQAFREVYILTDAELKTDLYSNRFAAHILRQHIFLALCKQRGWKYTIMGQWDSANTPMLEIPHYGIIAEYYVDAINDGANDMGIFNHIGTDQVRFSKGSEALHLYDVPALVFSEVMRDVDLFVGVTSIGADPMWADNGNQFQNRYWQEYSFSDLSESAVIRSQVIQSVIPQMKIASQCSFDKRFLIVKGKLRTYKIHMGSGNILMEPNDQYLCIVPASNNIAKSDKVFLPFEGDKLLSIILSKAILLAADDKIMDGTIVSQIRSKR